MADLTGPNPDEVNGVDAHDVPVTAKPLLTGGKASTAAPTSVSADGDAVNLWASRFGALNVILRDTSGLEVSALTLGSYNALAVMWLDSSGAVMEPPIQYYEDTPIGATGVGDLVLTRRDDALAVLSEVEGRTTSARVNNRGALWVSIADGSGNQITSFGGGTQYAVDAALGATPTGTLSLAIRDDALSALTPIEGDAVGLRVDGMGALWSTITLAGSAAGAPLTGAALSTGPDVNAMHVALTDVDGNFYNAPTTKFHDNAITLGSDRATAVFGRASAAAPASVSADDDYTHLWASRFGALNVILRDTSGAYASAAGSTQYVEDVAFAGNGTGTLMLARRDDALSTLTPVADDAVGLRVGDKGALWVQISDGAGAQITSFGGGTQYAEDAAFGGNATGTVMMARRDDALATLTPVEDDAVGARVNNRGALWVAIADGSGAQITSFGSPAKPSTGAQSNVAGTAADTTILASNASRLGATVTNDSTAILYLLLANSTSSSSVYTVKLAPGAYYEVPFGYTGVIKGIWASATGNAEVTELT